MAQKRALTKDDVALQEVCLTARDNPAGLANKVYIPRDLGAMPTQCILPNAGALPRKARLG